MWRRDMRKKAARKHGNPEGMFSFLQRWGAEGPESTERVGSAERTDAVAGDRSMAVEGQGRPRHGQEPED